MKKIIIISLIITATLVGGLMWYATSQMGLTMKDFKDSFGIEDPVFKSKPFSIMTNVDLPVKRSEYIQLDIVLTTTDKKGDERFAEEAEAIKEIIITYVNSQTRERLVQVDTREEVKKELTKLIADKTAINVTNIYFTNVLIQ